MTKDNFNNRIHFFPDLHVMEVDFSNMTFEVSGDVHSVYDEIDAQLEKSGQKWFFLVNYLNNHIMAEAWIAFAHRGKQTNLSYSLGSVRYAATEETSDAILKSAEKESFDPNLFSTREKALAQVEKIRDGIPEKEFQRKVIPTPPKDNRTPSERINFLSDDQIMEVDYSNYSFATSSVVNAFYDELTKQLSDTKQKWYFMVDYSNAEILPEAWYAWSMRGKELNSRFSLGTVRFDPRNSTKEELLRRSRADQFNPNLVSSREKAMQRIMEMKKERGRSTG